MRRRGLGWMGLAVILLQVSGQAMASVGNSASFSRDRTYEQDLRYSSSADQIITPQRVIQWLFNHQPSAKAASSTNAEFQPIVNVKDSKVRLVAAVAFTF